jgi:hypothetical protein
MFENWTKRKIARPKTSESTSLKQLSDDELRAKADECMARASAGGNFFSRPKPLGFQIPDMINDAEKTKLLLEAQSYLSEIDRREDAKVSTRDFGLEVAVIGLIVLEVLVDFWGLHKEAMEFDRQQAVLINLEKSSEATANTMVALQKTMDTMNAGIQNQLSLNYEISVGLVMNRGYWTLSVFNRGRTNITLWGSKIATEQRHMLSTPVTITPGESQDVDLPSFFEKMMVGSPPPLTQLTALPIMIFLRSENGQEYTAGCPFDTKKLLGLTGGSVVVQCQATTVRLSNWSHESR